MSVSDSVSDSNRCLYVGGEWVETATDWRDTAEWWSDPMLAYAAGLQDGESQALAGLRGVAELLCTHYALLKLEEAGS